LPCALIVAGASLHRFTLNAKWLAPVILLGNASYALYLIHPFMSIPRLVAQRFFSVTDGPWIWWPVAYALLLVIGMTAAAVLIHLYVEQPILHALRALRSSASETTARSTAA